MKKSNELTKLKKAEILSGLKIGQGKNTSEKEYEFLDKVIETVKNLDVKNDDLVYKKPVKQLSKREVEVFNLLKKGHCNNSIAEIIGINEKTVSTYLRRMKEKFEIPAKKNTYHVVNLIERELKKPL